MIDVLESMMMEGVAAGGLARRIPTAELAVELMERARTEGPGLVGPGGSLADTHSPRERPSQRAAPI